MPKNNAEKQARFRKKQELKKRKDKAFKEWQLVMGFGPRRETKPIVSIPINQTAPWVESRAFLLFSTAPK